MNKTTFTRAKRGFTFYPRVHSLPTKKGFTLIELLVVVAIIGVLATVVLASLGSARNKSKDAAIKAILSSMRAQAELQYLETGNYNNTCEPDSITGKMFRDAYAKAGVAVNSGNNICNDENNLYNAVPPSNLVQMQIASGLDPDGSIWAATIILSTGNWFCVDSLGTTAIDLSGQVTGTCPDKTC